MPGWGDILSEINNSADADGNVNIDAIRDKYIQQVTSQTGRPLVIYAADWLNKGGPQTSIDLGDMVGLMEVFRDQTSRELDLILHSPGGQAEACDRLVRYMRSKFDHVRVFIPMGAMSAATMWAMAADEIVMGKHSQLGPIDPQIIMPTGWTMPAGALTTQFKEASDECSADPSRLTGWLPTLQQYPPGILNVCENAAELAKNLVEEWLRTYMLKDHAEKDVLARDVAQWLADDSTHLSHSRAITREDLTAQGLTITPLEGDQSLQDAVLSVFHVLMHTFNGTAVKIIENQLGRRFVRHGGVQMVVNPGAPPPPQLIGP
ncbi:hypothetical protein JRC04_22940 [Mycolicibacterium sp. S2-37]|uniref:SDH family Clp fold serine proteinase n=1 Tax=Mycolicibacterium sp. S2-37 TaxID=2810297 RepID=UPI001A953535|nr:hypothetical protein [Mycolicibacterium sp. S2-37]MBO0680332.1 hypothetical protein [Mycolicibacterium sp. S2-37]